MKLDGLSAAARPVVAFQGERGCFSEAAAAVFVGAAGFDPLPRNSFAQVIGSVAGGAAAFGVLPLENSFTGSIHRNYDHLVGSSLRIVCECLLPVRQHLLGLPGAALERLREVHSHPQALSQCRSSLARWQTVPAADTAGSARMVAERGDETVAAVAGEHAARLYGLQILQADIQDYSGNTTRFVLLATAERAATPIPELVGPLTSGRKSSLAFVSRDVPGALFKALACFALRDVNLTKIESCPLPGRAWQVRFFLDFEGDAQQGPQARALANLEELADEIHLLGVYPCVQTEAVVGRPPQEEQ